ncbi:MAG TPA: hypothetical protein ENH41_00085, partial [Candidatus Omnitrophica bacterium]|nr:hypothetical protein [Candidatus Omnitrophota bacterium]
MSILILILVLGAIGLVIYILFGPMANAASLDMPEQVAGDSIASNRDAEAAAALQKELDILKLDAENNKTQIQSLTTELEAEKARKDELIKQEAESDKDGSSLEDLRLELADVRSGLIEKDRQLDEAHNANLNLKKDVEVYHHQLNDLKAEHSKMAEDFKQSKEEHRELEARIQDQSHKLEGDGLDSDSQSQNDVQYTLSKESEKDESSFDLKLKDASRVVTRLNPIEEDRKSDVVDEGVDELVEQADEQNIHPEDEKSAQ